MKSNTSEYIPYDSVSYNFIIVKGQEEYPYINGTGFFVHFPPYEDIFYITARHCFRTKDDMLITELESLQIPFSMGEGYTPKELNKKIPFSYTLTGKNIEDDENEDIIVFVVDFEAISSEEYNILKKRALRLQHQDDLNNMLKILCDKNENIRTVGFPKAYSGVNYDFMQVTAQPRGYYGKIKDNSKFKDRYGFENVNWKDKEYNGFSGSPILGLFPTLSENMKVNIQPIPLGVLVTATSSRGEFISINFATNLIANYLIQKFKIDEPI